MSGLARFVEAQERSYDRALAELTAGRKDGHWMWYIFPQLRGLGRSETARFYGIEDMAEARAYLAHPVLGPRLSACTLALLPHHGTPPERIMGGIDALKLRSSMTLFEAAGGGPEFGEVLEAYYGGERCPLTINLLAAS